MLLLNMLQQFGIDFTDFITIFAALGLLLLLVPAILSTPLLAVITESATPAKNKSFYSKCARQICQVPFGLGLLIFTLLGLGFTVSLLQLQPEVMRPPLIWGPVTAIAVPFLALLLLTVYLGTWSPLRKQRGLHLFLGYLAAIACLAVLLAGFVFLGALLQPIPQETVWTTPGENLRNLLGAFMGSPVLWLVSAYLLCMGFAAGTGIAQLWLIMRRHKEDYGRDYYNFAMRYCARLSLIFTVIATAVAGVIFWQLWASVPPEFLQPQDRGVLLVAFGLPLSCCLLWLCVLKSETPLRHKPGAFFACLFLYLALCAQMLFYLSTFPMV